MELSWFGSLPLWESLVFFGSVFAINFLLSPFIEGGIGRKAGNNDSSAQSVD